MLFKVTYRRFCDILVSQWQDWACLNAATSLTSRRLSVKLICIIGLYSNPYHWLYQGQKEYLSFVFKKGDEPVIDGRFPKKHYRSYSLFAAITGKFDGYVILPETDPDQRRSTELRYFPESVHHNPALRICGGNASDSCKFEERRPVGRVRFITSRW